MKNIFMKFNMLFLLAIAFVACDDKLNLDPIDTVDEEVALKTSADVEGLLIGAYNDLSDGDLLGGNIQRDAELLGDDGEIFWDGTFIAPQEIYSKDMLIDNDQAEATWLDAYQTINTCNLVLANLDLVSADRVERVEGEAKFVRGLVYFELTRLYARTWIDGDPTLNPGVPLVLEPTSKSNVNVKVGRSKVNLVYAQIIQDLTEAETLLPETNAFFATTYSASAILSRVYLTQNNYLLARNAANRVIQSGEFSLNPKFADAFNKSSSQITDRNRNANASSEDVFAIQVTNQDGVNNLNTFFGSADFGGRGDILIDPPHFDLYEPNDARASLFYDGQYTAKFNNQFGNIPVVRLSEMYLTRAESNLRINASVGAAPLDDVNTVRTRAGLANLFTISIGRVLLERQIELAFEGHKLHDFRRTQRAIGGDAWDADNLIFPIPQRERLINPSLEQNDAYTSSN